jgi:hypothetical protein
VNRGDRIGGQGQTCAVAGSRFDSLSDPRPDLEAWRRGEPDVDAEQHSRLRQGRRHVVAVADERDRPARQIAQPLRQRQAVGQRLARVLLVGQRVDHAEARRRRGERLEARLRVSADDRAVDPPLEIPSHVGNRLPLAEHFLTRRLDDVSSELPHGDLERRSGSQRGLLEQQSVVPPLQRPLVCNAGGARRLELRRQLQTAQELVMRHVVDRQKPRRHHRCQLACAHVGLRPPYVTLSSGVQDGIRDAGPGIRALNFEP